jgi:transposase-like protein
LAYGETIAETAQKQDVRPHQVTEWRRQLSDRAAEVFAAPAVDCPRRSNFDPPCQLNFDPGLVAEIA